MTAKEIVKRVKKIEKLIDKDEDEIDERFFIVLHMMLRSKQAYYDEQRTEISENYLQFLDGYNRLVGQCFDVFD